MNSDLCKDFCFNISPSENLSKWSPNVTGGVNSSEYEEEASSGESASPASSPLSCHELGFRFFKYSRSGVKGLGSEPGSGDAATDHSKDGTTCKDSPASAERAGSGYGKLDLDSPSWQLTG